MIIKRPRISAGTLLEIPVEGVGIVVAKVLYVSRYFRSVILLGIYRERGVTPESTTEHVPDLLLYTATQCCGPEGWPVAGFENVSEAEQRLSTRVVAGEVWFGDQCIRPASPNDRRALPVMAVSGCKAVETHIRQALGTTGRTPLTRGSA